MEPFSVSSTVRSYPSLPYETIKNDILGKRYQLSLAFVGSTRAQTLNNTHRKKSYVPNVLSFPLTDTTGEVVITPKVAEKEAKKFDLTPKGYCGYLFIHGCLHLKGHDHGDTMESTERRLMKKYKLT